MSLHPEIEADFRRALTSGAVPRDLTGRDAADVAQRFNVYRNNVAVGLREALERRYPAVARIVGDEFAAALFGAYARTHPPDSPVLLAYGAGFPAFLEAFPPVASLPYLADVARLEYARGRAYHAADIPGLGVDELGRLAEADPDTLVLELHPSLCVLRSPHPVHAIWRMNQPGQKAERVTDWSAEAVLVARSGLTLLTEPLAADAAICIAALAEGASLTAAARAAGPEYEPAPALARLIAAGLVTGASQAAPDAAANPDTTPQTEMT